MAHEKELCALCVHGVLFYVYCHCRYCCPVVLFKFDVDLINERQPHTHIHLKFSNTSTCLSVRFTHCGTHENKKTQRIKQNMGEIHVQPISLLRHVSAIFTQNQK